MNNSPALCDVLQGITHRRQFNEDLGAQTTTKFACWVFYGSDTTKLSLK